MSVVQGTDRFSIVDSGDVPAVEDIALVDTDKSFGQLFLKGFKGLEGRDDISVPHIKIGAVVVRFEVKDFPGVQIPIIIIGLQAQGSGYIVLWMLFSQAEDGLSHVKFVVRQNPIVEETTLDRIVGVFLGGAIPYDQGQGVHVLVQLRDHLKVLQPVLPEVDQYQFRGTFQNSIHALGGIGGNSGTHQILILLQIELQL